MAAHPTDTDPTGRATPRGRAVAPRPAVVPGRDCAGAGRQPGIGDALAAPPRASWGARLAPAPSPRPALPVDCPPVAPALPAPPAWRPSGRVRDRALDAAPDRPGGRARVRSAVPLPGPGTGVACARVECPATDPAGQGARRRLGGSVAPAGLAAPKKGARRTGRAIAFVDETGHTFRARVGTTWAPRGQPPLLRRVSQRREVSSIAALVAPLDGPPRLYARHFLGAIHGEEVITALRYFRRRIGRPLVIVWDRLPAHQARPVQQFLARHPADY